MKLDLSELNGLSEEDRDQIDAWLDEYGYRKTARLASEKFNRAISSNTIGRFANRAAPKHFLDDSPEAQETATQILQFAVSGQPQFTEAAVHVLEQTAFKLTFSCTHRAENMKALMQISTMLFRHRNASVRERLAKVQEQKIELRREELQGRGILATKSPPSPPLDPAWIARKKAEFQQRFSTKVGDDVRSPTSTSANETSALVSTASSNTIPVPKDCQEPDGFNSNSRGLSPRNPRFADETDSTPDEVPQTAPNENSASEDTQTESTATRSIPSPETQPPGHDPSPELQILRARFLGLLKTHIEKTSTPVLVDSRPKTQDSRLSAQNYTLRRTEEYNRWKSDHAQGKPNCPTSYRTEIPECPCGNRLQCPDHPWPHEFYFMNPEHPEYEQALAKNGLFRGST